MALPAIQLNSATGVVFLVPIPVMPPSFWVASTKPEAALNRSKAGQPC